MEEEGTHFVVWEFEKSGRRQESAPMSESRAEVYAARLSRRFKLRECLVIPVQIMEEPDFIEEPDKEDEPTHRVEWALMSNNSKMGCDGPMTEGRAHSFAYDWNRIYPEFDHWVAPLPADWRETMKCRYDHGLKRFTYLPKKDP